MICSNTWNAQTASKITLIVTLAAATVAANAADWPQWRGPARNGISAEIGWSSKWPTGGPRKVWSAQVGEGYSAVAVSKGRVYTAGNAGGTDTIYCFNENTGAEIWRYAYPCPPGDYTGPRATPVVDGGRVYMMSRTGGVVCLTADKGKIVWGRDVAREAGAQEPQWGFAGSPLVEGNLVYLSIGENGTALDKNTGRVVWKSGGQSGYASPVVFSTGSSKQLLVFSGTHLNAVDPATGRKIWQHGWATSFGVNASDPQFAGTDLFLSSAYNHGCALLKAGGGTPSVIWENRNMRNKFNSTLQYNGALYGNDEGTLRCLDLKTGNERWSSRGIGMGGGLIGADGKLIYLTERGELVVAEANPKQYQELARAQVLSTRMAWTHPVLANGKIYCRSHEGELTALDVKR